MGLNPGRPLLIMYKVKKDIRISEYTHLKMSGYNLKMSVFTA
jgi:hypothetical protein